MRLAVSTQLLPAVILAAVLLSPAVPNLPAHAAPLQLAQDDPAANDPAAPAEEEISEDERMAAEAAFERFKETISVINENIKGPYGGPPFVKVENVGIRVVKITPSEKWMEIKERHHRNAMMLYRMWRNANQFRPVTLIIADETGAEYMSLRDSPTGLQYRARQY